MIFTALSFLRLIHGLSYLLCEEVMLDYMVLNQLLEMFYRKFRN